MNFLEKILTNVIKYGTLILTGAPLFGALVPQKDQGTEQAILGDIQQFIGVATTVEATAAALAATGNVNGKIAAVSQGVSQVLLGTPFLTAHKIQDPVAFKQACDLYAQATQVLLASLHADGVQLVSKKA